jgi:type VI secretion system secreted protein VgrG
MSDSAGTSYVTLTIDPDPGFELTLDGLSATEELGRPFQFDLDLTSAKAQGNLQSVLGSSVTISLALPGGSKRYFNGIVARIAYAGLSRGAYRYTMQLRPWIWLLSRVQDCKIFQNQSAFAIISSVFRDAGFSDFEDKRQSQSGDITLDYCVQYRETSLDFVTRLMETFGIYYYFTHADGQHTLVLADDPNSHTAVTPAIPYKTDETEYRSVEDHVWEWSADLALQPGAWTFRDYNFTTPTADLTAKSIKAGQHPHGTLEMYEYPGPYDTAGNGQKLATVRMQDMAARRQVYAGTSNARGIVCGGKFTLSGATDTSLNQEYLIIQATYSISGAESMSDDDGELTDTYRGVFQAIPSTTQFRLDRQTPRPLITGPQTAKVVGASGDEITTDQYGRIKVKFNWDRSAAQDENASCWIRVAQVWAGVSWGGMFIPRVGQEVVVEFLEGNPDRPIVTGSVYNANVTIPYAQPGNATRSTIKSNSSKGGGGFNELRFEDKKGSEEVFFQAQKDYNKVVLNNETVKITQDTTTTVDKGKREVTLNTGDNSLTVSQGKNTTTVSVGNDSLTVTQGDHSITVTAGKSSVTAGTSITLTVGANSIKIDTSGVTITAAKLEVTTTGEVSVTSGAKMGLTAGAPMTLTAPMININ